MGALSDSYTEIQKLTDPVRQAVRRANSFEERPDGRLAFPMRPTFCVDEAQPRVDFSPLGDVGPGPDLIRDALDRAINHHYESAEMQALFLCLNVMRAENDALREENERLQAEIQTADEIVVTDEMIEAGLYVLEGCGEAYSSDHLVGDIYRAMSKAAPTPAPSPASPPSPRSGS